MHISCPTGSVVHVISAFYGRLDRTTCPHKAMHSTSCTLPGITDTVRAICQDKAACDVSGPFTNPCARTYKYLKVTYECRRTTTACGNDTMHISCPSGSVVHVISAFYGRLDTTTCPLGATQTTTCSLPGITDTVRTICQDKTTCDVSGPFTDPCVGTYKYLKVTYKCPLRKTACDARLHISCPPGKVINVISALFGRLDTTTCPLGPTNSTSCRLPGMTEKVRRICQDKTACDVSGPFGDPCDGTYKYLQANYECRLECLNQPCQNGATCVDVTDGFACVCPEYYTGTTCSEQIPIPQSAADRVAIYPQLGRGLVNSTSRS
ncbi:L-rhamnose-binding lectin CSL1 [Lamellibrachia satsuma]|nr:L-rhamnose-binding lectin CSL1 [Lamellibrachia satsuma]